MIECFIIAIICVTVSGIICVLMNLEEKRCFECNKKESKIVQRTLYEKYFKRSFDILFSIVGIIFFLPIMLISMLIVLVDDPGPVIFKQKRVGIYKNYFYIHKLRSMRRNTGDIPTHMLSQSDQENMILKSGRIFRKMSIDELPQFFDILRGKMSIVGPRPALWNQEDLITARDTCMANMVRPGLTGLAQISGRDELEIQEKAQLDGIYVTALKKSNWSGFLMDARCFFGTITSVLFSRGVVEGGTGKNKK